MARPKAKAPARRYHISGQSVVTIDGRDFYLGMHDSSESIARYACLIAAYRATGLSLPQGFDLSSLDAQVAVILGHACSLPQQQSKEPVLVRHVTALYRAHVAEKYRNAKEELNRNNKLCDEIDADFGDIVASDFGPVRLRAID